MVKNLTWWDKFVNTLFNWQGFTLPVGEELVCYKDRSRVSISRSERQIEWGANERFTSMLDPGKVGRDGVGSGTPMQLGRPETRTVTWGSGYGRVNQWKCQIPLPLVGSRYWITGYPVPMFDKRCIIMGPDGKVHELIQFDQDAPVLPAGMPQQALNRGMWSNGVLIDGVATTAAGLPSHGYVWGRGSAAAPHCQAMTVQDYVGGDGTDQFEALYPNGCKCGDWYFLPVESQSYKNMMAKGGECAARAQAMSVFGVRLIDRGNRTSVLTQAGTWARSTNISQFTIDIRDLRYAE